VAWVTQGMSVVVYAWLVVVVARGRLCHPAHTQRTSLTPFSRTPWGIWGRVRLLARFDCDVVATIFMGKKSRIASEGAAAAARRLVGCDTEPPPPYVGLSREDGPAQVCTFHPHRPKPGLHLMGCDWRTCALSTRLAPPPLSRPHMLHALLCYPRCFPPLALVNTLPGECAMGEPAELLPAARQLPPLPPQEPLRTRLRPPGVGRR